MSTLPPPMKGVAFQPPPVPQPQPVEELPMSGAAIAPHLTFWQQPWVQNLLPLITSLTVHLVIIIIAIMARRECSRLTKRSKLTIAPR